MFFKKHKGKIIALIITAVLLSSTYLWEENRTAVQAPEQEKIIEEVFPESTVKETTEETTLSENIVPSEEQESDAPEKEEVITQEKIETVCTFSVRCDTILNNIDKLKEEKHSLVPQNGIIIAEVTVPFSEGESVFDVLLRETRHRGIHFEYIETPMYNSVYIEGINNLYEKDCGELSGWIYTVNGEVPGCGCSLYYLEPGDCVELIYTCNMGKDI